MTLFDGYNYNYYPQQTDSSHSAMYNNRDENIEHNERTKNSSFRQRNYGKNDPPKLRKKEHSIRGHRMNRDYKTIINSSIDKRNRSKTQYTKIGNNKAIYNKQQHQKK